MKSTFRPAAVLLAVLAVLALAPAAMAKGGGTGGGGGGDASCAKFSSYTLTAGSLDATRASLVADYSIAYSCLDEFWPPISFDIKDEATGQTFRSVFGGPILPGMHQQVFAAAYAHKYTVTTTLTQANGKIYDTRTNTITTPDAPATL